MKSPFGLPQDARLARLSIILVLKSLSKIETVDDISYSKSLNLIESHTHQLRYHSLTRKEKMRAATIIAAQGVAMIMKALVKNEDS
jgi:hypothetical protein